MLKIGCLQSEAERERYFRHLLSLLLVKGYISYTCFVNYVYTTAVMSFDFIFSCILRRTTLLF